MKKITIYTTRFCGYCNAAKKWLEQKGLEYQEIRLYEGNEMEKFRGWTVFLRFLKQWILQLRAWMPFVQNDMLKVMGTDSEVSVNGW